MGMFFAPLKLNVYFPVLTYDRGVWSMLMIKDGEYRVQKPMLICFSEKWTFLRLNTGGGGGGGGGRIYFSGGSSALAPRKFFQHTSSPFISQY